MFACISEGGTGQTLYLNDNELVKEVQFVDERIIDWVMPDLPQFKAKTSS